MSRISKLPIQLSDKVKINFNVEYKTLFVNVEGSQGKLSRSFPNVITLIVENNMIKVLPIEKDNKQHNIMSGTVRSIINSMVKGVENPFALNLTVSGPGYRASTDGKYLNLSLGKSHGTKIVIPSDIKIECPKLNIIKLSSINKESLGFFAHLIIKQRPVDLYKGNGIYKEGTLVLKKRVKKG